MFKTLVMRGDRNGVCLAVVPGNTEANDKALARLTGDRRVEMVPLKEIQGLTGYIRGGVTAIACKRGFPVYVDETAELFDTISVSAGVRGTQVLLSIPTMRAVVSGNCRSHFPGKTMKIDSENFMVHEDGKTGPPKQVAHARQACLHF